MLCPGLATAVGKMPAQTSAFQMLKAYEHVVFGRTFPHGLLEGFQTDHSQLIARREGSDDSSVLQGSPAPVLSPVKHVKQTANQQSQPDETKGQEKQSKEESGNTPMVCVCVSQN